ncbi:L-rhamnose mutarotase, partial [Lactobacillus sp. XV13L]|nr:L-rhamnose mutarotase [Lactobacillus sp. XV13L]
MTVRMAQLMHVYSDQYEEYERRHNNLFPEMKQALKDAGAHNYSIYLDKNTGNLFAYLEVDDVEKYN